MKRIVTTLILASSLVATAAGTVLAWPGDGGVAEPSSARPARAERGNAANRARAHRRGHGAAHGLMAQLELTDAQKTAIRTLREAARAERRDGRASLRDLSPDARRALVTERRAALRAAIAGVLTDAQEAKLAELRANRPPRARGAATAPRNGRGRGRGAPNR
jgi:Spy/CpxP family protein refolding chaperone